MPRKKTESAQLRLTVPAVVLPRVQRMADAMAMDVPTLLRYMVSSQLVQWEAMVVNPEKYAEAVKQFTSPAAAPAFQRMADEVQDLATAEEPKDDRPGFRPGGKPRSELEEPVYAHGELWTGYMKGL